MKISKLTQLELKTLHDQLKAIREAEELSRPELQGLTGISKQHLYEIESGRYVPKLEWLSKVLKAMGYKLYIGKDNDNE
jgi:DNA-binding XRE family transcriptional regulator